MDWTQIIQALITASVTLLTSIPLTIRATRNKANADAMQSVQAVYKQTLDDLRDDKNRQRDEFMAEIGALRHEVQELRQAKDKQDAQLNQNTRDITRLNNELDRQRPYLCYAHCPNRKDKPQ